MDKVTVVVKHDSGEVAATFENDVQQAINYLEDYDDNDEWLALEVTVNDLKVSEHFDSDQCAFDWSFILGCWAEERGY